MFRQFTTKSKSDAIAQLSSSELGITTQEANNLYEKFGKNEVKSKSDSWHEILIRQLKSPFLFLLIASSLILFILDQKIDGAMILLFITINTSLGFIQEYRSSQAVKLLKKYLTHKVKVIRDRHEALLQAEDLVPGDVVILEPGDIIPSDVRFIKCDALIVDESALTGESKPVEKTDEKMNKDAKDIFEAHNIGFSGTVITSGKAHAIVIATGSKTEFGLISKLTIDTTKTSTFEKGIARFSKFILRLIIITLIILFIANAVIKSGKTPILELAVFSVALAVSVVPEALPIVTSFSLTQGAVKLAKKKVVIKRLSAIEDLGEIEILATDKTGTITENRLTVTQFWGDDKEKLISYANLAGSQKLTNPFDISLWQKTDDKTKDEINSWNRIKEIPFDPERRRSTVIASKNKEKIIISRGATEDILALCNSKTDKEEIIKFSKQKGENGERVLAVAYKKINKNDKESDLKFLGLISFKDPLKPSTKMAVEDAKNLGVKIKILTGDALEVAVAIAKEVNILTNSSQAITGQNFENATPDMQKQIVQNCSVFARVTPQQKYQIIKVLQENYEVGFLGEGINDAPALKISGVSLVVDGASDIARDASDIVLLKKDLEVIIEGIKEGRKIFANTKKYITATLASNFGNFYAVAIASLLVDFLPLLPLQILLVNLLSDFPMISIASDNVDEDELRLPSHYDIKGILFKATVLGIVSTIFDFLFFGIFVRSGAPVLQTAWFMGSILTELVFLFSIRTNKFFAYAKSPSIAVLVLTIVASISTVVIPFTQFGRDVFKFVNLNSYQVLIVFILVILYFATTESVKLLYSKANPRS